MRVAAPNLLEQLDRGQLAHDPQQEFAEMNLGSD